MRKPLVIDLYCGLGGWAEGFLSEGWDVIGFDIERHCYGDQKYPAQLVLQDVLTLHGRQFKDVAAIVASPPCQEYSYMAMPWSRAKQIAAALREDAAGRIDFPEDYTGSRTVAQLNALFNVCFRLQREASEAAGRHIPMVVENVKGAQPWVGPAQAHFGSFYLWGDVRQVGGRIVSMMPKFGEGLRVAQHRKVNTKYRKTGSWKTEDGRDWRDITNTGQKVEGFNFHQHENGGPGGSFQSAAVKVAGLNWSKGKHTGDTPQGFNVVAAQRYREQQGIKQEGSGAAWFDKALDERRKEATAVKNGKDWFGSGENCSLQRRQSSRSNSRKAASAMIAKIPFDLASHIARCFKPAAVQRSSVPIPPLNLPTAVPK